MSATLTVDAWLKATLVDDPAVMAVLPGGVHEGEAPKGTPSPHLVVEYAADAVDTNFNNARALTVVFPHLKVMGQDVPTSALLAAFNAVDAKLSHAPITDVPGLGTISGCIRVSETRGADHLDGHVFRWLGGSFKVVVSA